MKQNIFKRVLGAFVVALFALVAASCVGPVVDPPGGGDDGDGGDDPIVIVDPDLDEELGPDLNEDVDEPAIT